MRSAARASGSFMVSGRYKIHKNGSLPPQPILIEHCCLMTKGNDWDISIKCRPHSNQRKSKKNWRNLKEVYPDAKVEEKHNDIELTLPLLRENLEVAAFGIPGKDDQKRMQMAIFGKKPTQGCDWKIRVYLIDDSKLAFKWICKKEEDTGNRLLTTLSSLFVSNIEEDIRIEFTDMDPAWQIEGSNMKAITSGDAWNSPEDSTNFPCCDFVVSHIDTTKQQFFCGITVSHEKDSGNTELVAFFEQKSGNKINQPFDTLKKLENFRRKSLPNDKNVQLLSEVLSLLEWFIYSGLQQMLKESDITG